ncbi:16S rRNA (adenine(1518)-N(6)/adenine(1519)-N(6))-dimethyltransferase RsmA [Schleiferia thermophila]
MYFYQLLESIFAQMSFVRPKKSLGQHFLTNKSVAQRIAALAHNSPCKNLLEVGPGMGILTNFLISDSFYLKAIELDRESVQYLRANFRELTVIEGDFLKLDFNTLFEGEEYGIIGNYPYNISTQIVFKIIEHQHLIPWMGGMFQREVALRIGAKPGGKDYGILSVLTQLFYRVTYEFTVEPGNFNPVPKVRSGVITLQRLETPLCPEGLFPRVREIVKAAFNQRRKTLRNALKMLNYSMELGENPIFERRAEQLSPEDFVKLTKALSIANQKT